MKQKPILFLLAVLMASLSPLSALSFKGSPGLEYLEKTSQAFTQIGKKASPSVVFIKATHKAASPHYEGYEGSNQFENPFDLFHEEFFRRFFGAPRGKLQQQQQSPQTSGGSGFIVSEDGYILTNFHVIKDAHSITAVLNNGKEHDATIIGIDPRTDLAVLKIEGEKFPALHFADSAELEKGEWVVAIGNPFALESSLTVGVVSAIGRQDLGIATLEDFIQTDAAINPGNSGGPLLNLNGDVIGINTAIVTRSGGYMGIGFAIPSNLAKHVMHQIIEEGVVKRAYLGVILQTIDEDLATAMNLDTKEGILVAEVVKDSPAEQAGLRNGDIILSLNDKPVKSINKFRNEIALMEPGSSVNLKVLRNQKTLHICLPLGTLTETEVASAELSQKLGMEVENINDLPSDVSGKMGYLSNQEGVVITKIRPGSPAAQAGLKPYFLITGVVVNWNDQKKVKNVSEFNEALHEIGNKKHIVLIVRHQNYQRYYTIRLS